MKNKYKTYSELIKIKTFQERLEYLMLSGTVGEMTFGGKRQLNQILYKTPEWQSTRREVILRDSDGDYCLDLACREYPITRDIYIHHINPITAEDIVNRRPCVFDLENLIACSFVTHNQIHYGIPFNGVPFGEIIRAKNDTCPWK